MTNQDRRISFSPPDISELEIQYVTEVLKSGWITTGEKTKRFEANISSYTGCKKTICLSSATAAMELVLRALGIGPGDEVITPAYTYTASASVIAHVGAKIVLVDVAPNTFFLDYEQLSGAITPRTKAVIPVDLGGVMVDYDRIFQVLEQKKHLWNPSTDLQKAFDRPIVVADAAHSFGATYHGMKSGQAADITCFSFHAVKNLTTAEGGAITWTDHPGVDDDDVYKTLKLLSLHGQNKDALTKKEAGTWQYDIKMPGYKCNMTDITAAMGLAQLERFDALKARREKICAAYDRAFASLGIGRLDHFRPGFEGNYHLYLTRIPGIGADQRRDIIIKMGDYGIPCNVHFTPLPMHTAYRNMGLRIDDFPNSYAQYINEITLPMHTLLSDDDVAYIADVYKRVLEDYL